MVKVLPHLSGVTGWARRLQHLRLFLTIKPSLKKRHEFSLDVEPASFLALDFVDYIFMRNKYLVVIS